MQNQASSNLNEGQHGNSKSQFLLNPSQYLLSQLSQFGPVKA